MAHVPAFEFDIFISYAHVDNEPIDTDLGGRGQFRWVSDFTQRLQRRLAQLLGDSVAVWRDPRLEGNEVLWDTIQEHLSQSAALVSVLSPRYVRSESCAREIQLFQQNAERSGGLQIGTRKRVFKVLKTPVDWREHPGVVRDLTGYKFYRRDPESGRVREFHLDASPDASKKYLETLDDLAHDIQELLEEMRRRLTGDAAPTSNLQTSIYLAETTSDLRGEREQLVRELKDRRYNILPAGRLPDEAEELKQAVRADLQHCQLSIHPIGANYGRIPEGEARSVVVLQHELAAERSREGKLSQVIWMRPTLQPADNLEKEFIEQLETYPGSRGSFELLKAGIEDLKTYIREKLQGRPKSPLRTDSEEGAARVYLIFDSCDLHAVQPLKDYLRKGLEVIVPVMSGTVSQVREIHEEYLRLCDAVMVFYGEADELWFRARELDLWKAPGLGRKKPLAALIYLGAPKTPDKEEFQTRRYEVVRSFEGFTPAHLSSFLARFEGGIGVAV